MAGKVKIALIQFESILANIKANTEKAVGMCRKAADNGVNIICLPELFSTGYNLNLIGKELLYLGQTENDETITALRTVAKEKGCYIIAPIALYKDLPGILYNSAVMIGDRGEILGIYDKNHLWASERLYFRNGADYPVFKTKYGTVGIMICYDMGFPETARFLTLQGAEIIFCPSAWRSEDRDIWNLNIPQRALENTVFLAAVNRFGQEGDDLYLFGGSKVCNPRGQVLAEIKEEKEAILYCEIDLNEIIAQRVLSPYIRDRRPEQYHFFYDNNIRFGRRHSDD